MFLIRFAILCAITIAWLGHARAGSCSTVTMITDQGTIELEVFDVSQPAVVNNFLSYVIGEDYTNSLVHRTVPGFVIQGGGFFLSNSMIMDIQGRTVGIQYPLGPSNLRGTIAMAENASGATSQWFINLADNSRLDPSFTVFGEVTSGMDVVDAIAAIPRFAFASPFNEIPLENYTLQNFLDGDPVADEDFVLVESMTVPEPRFAALAALLALAVLRRSRG